MTSCRRREDGKRRRSFAPETPHFFKIILSHTLQTGRLGIPKTFVRKYGRNLPETVRLTIPNGGSWRVELEKWDDMVWLSKGWKEFTEHYSICEGHFLVFKYVGDLDFHVLIFDKSASEIDYPLTNADSKKSNLGTVEFVPPKKGDADAHCNLSVGLQSLDGFSLKRKGKDELHLKPYAYHHKPSKVMKSDPVTYVDDATISHATVLGSGSKSKGFRTDQGAKLLLQDSEGRIKNSKRKVSPAMLASRSPASRRSRVTTALKEANEYEPQYPSFTAVIRSNILLKQSVVRKDPEIIVLMCKIWTGMNLLPSRKTVPGGILKGRIDGSMQIATLKYSDGSWPVKLWYYPQHGSGKLSAGWAAFQRGTSLKEGDVCVFELVRIDNIELKVSIFRKNVKT